MTFNYVSHSMLEYFKTKFMAWVTAGFDAIGAAAAVLGSNGDAATANTVYGAKAYADTKKSEVIGTASDQASANTINGAKAYADAAIADAIISAYKPGGSKTAAEILDTTNDLLVAANEGKVYNVSSDLTIAAADKARFVENVEGAYAAGSNVVVINAGTAETPAYKFDVLPGMTNMVDITTATIDSWFTSGE